MQVGNSLSASQQQRNFEEKLSSQKQVSFVFFCLCTYFHQVPGLSLIFQVDGELKKVAGGQKKPGASAVGRGGGWVQWRLGA